MPNVQRSDSDSHQSGHYEKTAGDPVNSIKRDTKYHLQSRLSICLKPTKVASKRSGKSRDTKIATADTFLLSIAEMLILAAIYADE
jgi:hypothetical protein